MKARTESFELLIDGMPFIVKATPFVINDETRFRVSYNGSPVSIFVWDNELNQFRAIDQDAVNIPDSLELAIAEKLESTVMAHAG